MKTFRVIPIGILPVLLCALFLTCADAHGQGSILIQNIGPGYNATVQGPDGALIPAGNAYTVELWVGVWPDALTPVSEERRTFTAPGYFGVGSPQAIVPGFSPGSHPWCQVRIWNNQGGTITNYAQAISAGVPYYPSRIFQLGVGLGNPTVTPVVPAAFLSGLMGPNPLDQNPQLRLIRFTSDKELTVRSTTSSGSSSLQVLTSTNLSSPSNWTPWSVVTNAPAEYEFAVPIATNEPARFFRVLRVP